MYNEFLGRLSVPVHASKRYTSEPFVFNETMP